MLGLQMLHCAPCSSTQLVQILTASNLSASNQPHHKPSTLKWSAVQHLQVTASLCKQHMENQHHSVCICSGSVLALSSISSQVVSFNVKGMLCISCRHQTGCHVQRTCCECAHVSSQKRKQGRAAHNGSHLLNIHRAGMCAWRSITGKPR